MNSALIYREILRWRRNSGPLSLAAYPVLLLLPLVLVCLTDGYSDPREALSKSSWLLLLAHLGYFAVRTLGATVPWVARERELGSFEALRGTGIGEGEYLWVRLGSVVAGRVVELALWSPLLMVPVGLHLASLAQMAALVLATVGLVFFWAALGLCCSAWSGSTFRASQAAYGLLATMTFGSSLLDLIGGFHDRLFFSTASPVVGATALFWPDTVPASPWILLFQVAAGFPLMGLALAGLRTERRTRRPRRRSAAPWLSRVIQNPVLYRELSGRPWLRQAAPYVLGVTAVLVYGHRMGCFDPETWLTLAVGLHFCYFTGRSVASAVRSVAQERQRGTWDCLLSSSVTPEQLYWGKFWGVVLPLLVEMALALPVFAWFCVPLNFGWVTLLGVVLTTLAWLACLTAMGIWLSYRTSAGAVWRWAAMLVGGLVFGGPLVDVIVTRNVLLSYSSPILGLSAMTAFPVPRIWTALFFVVLYGLAAWAVTTACLREFRRGVRCGLEPLPPYQRRIHRLG